MFPTKVTRHMGIPISKLRNLQRVLLGDDDAIVGQASIGALLVIRLAMYTRLDHMPC